MTTLDVLSSPVLPILIRLEHEGFKFRVLADGTIQVSPVNRLTVADAAAFRQHAADARALIAIATDQGVQDRRDRFREQYDNRAEGVIIPAFLFVPGLAYVVGSCFSCGECLGTPTVHRCWRCSVAWRLVMGISIPASLADHYDSARVA